MQPARRFIRSACASLIVAVACASAATAQAQNDDSHGREISLRHAVELIIARNPLTRAKRLDVERAQLDVQIYDSFWTLPQFTFNSLTGVVPAARGDIFNSPDTSNDLDDLGPFFRFEIGIIIPIYTFGRIRNAASAARSIVQVEQSKGRKVRNDLAREVIKAYWGLVASERALDVGERMRDSYRELLDKIQEKLDADEIDPNDAFEAQAGAYDVERSYLDTIELSRLVQRGLAELLGYDPDVPLVPTDTEAPQISLQPSDLDRLIRIAERVNPDLRTLQAAVGALEAAMDLELSNRWPVVVVGGGFSLAKASGRDDQRNPFAYDEFNFRRLAAAFNLRWDLNFPRHRIDYLRRKFERDSTAAKGEALRIKLGLQVHQALERVLKNVELVISARQTRRVTRRWLRTAFDDWDLGIGEAQPMLKAYAADYRLQAQVIETQYQLDVSLAELALVMGDLHSYLQWVADGQVVLE